MSPNDLLEWHLSKKVKIKMIQILKKKKKRLLSDPHMKLAITKTYNQESSNAVKIICEIAPLITKIKKPYFFRDSH